MNKKNKVRTFWNEKWKKITTPIPTKTCNYYISNYGKIKSVNKEDGSEQELKGSTLRGGYKQLNLRLTEDKRFSLYVHKFVAKSFIPNRSKKRQFVIHLDQNKANNHWQNLKWVSREELTQWQIEIGIYDSQNKKRASNTKLTDAKVRLLKRRLRAGRTKKKILAKQMGISTMQLNRIERGVNWAHVTID